MTTPPTPRRGGLGTRLLAALALVLVTAGLTAWLVAGAVGPAVFHEHMLRSGVDADAQVISHAEEAFRTASGLALTIALGAATLASLVVSLFLTRRIGASLSALTSAARRVAGGRFDARVPPPGMGAEFDEVAGAFNQMASRLDASEEVRRRLLSDVAHELRTPVATLNAHLEGLEDGVTELNAQTLELLRAQGVRLTRLAEDLAAVTRAESGEIRLALEPIDPVTLLHQAYLTGRDRSEALGVELRVEVDHPLPHVLVDTERMAQVLGNLVDNALRHAGTGQAVVLAGELIRRARPPQCHRQRRGHRRPPPPAHLRTVLPCRQRAGPSQRGVRHRAGDHQGPGRGTRRHHRRHQCGPRSGQPLRDHAAAGGHTRSVTRCSGTVDAEPW